MARALRAWAINRGGKNSVRNLRYGPRTRLVRGIYHNMINKTNVKKESARSSINNKWTKTLYRYYLHSNANLFATVLNAFSKEIISMNIK